MIRNSTMNLSFAFVICIGVLIFGKMNVSADETGKFSNEINPNSKETGSKCA